MSFRSIILFAIQAYLTEWRLPIEEKGSRPSFPGGNQYSRRNIGSIIKIANTETRRDPNKRILRSTCVFEYEPAKKASVIKMVMYADRLASFEKAVPSLVQTTRNAMPTKKELPILKCTDSESSLKDLLIIKLPAPVETTTSTTNRAVAISNEKNIFDAQNNRFELIGK